MTARPSIAARSTTVGTNGKMAPNKYLGVPNRQRVCTGVPDHPCNLVCILCVMGTTCRKQMLDPFVHHSIRVVRRMVHPHNQVVERCRLQKPLRHHRFRIVERPDLGTLPRKLVGRHRLLFAMHQMFRYPSVQPLAALRTVLPLYPLCVSALLLGSFGRAIRLDTHSGYLLHRTVFERMIDCDRSLIVTSPSFLNSASPSPTSCCTAFLAVRVVLMLVMVPSSVCGSSFIKHRVV